MGIAATSEVMRIMGVWIRREDAGLIAGATNTQAEDRLHPELSGDVTRHTGPTGDPRR
jgi:hypothetical protein